MNKNLSITYSLLLFPLVASSSLLSMELTNSNGKFDAEKNPLTESVIIIHTPKTRGLGLSSYLKDFVWNEEDNTFTALASKTLDLNNSSYHRKLDTAVENYSNVRPNSLQLAKMLFFCRQDPYAGHIQISAISFHMGHNFLVGENKQKQIAFKKRIETNDSNFINHFNVLLKDLQNTLTEKIKNMDACLKTHLDERNAIVPEEGKSIRIIKAALINLHHLNKEKNVLLKTENNPEDGYCSDSETNSDNVDNSYNDEYLLKKINVNLSMEQTKVNTEKILKRLYECNSNIVDIDPVAYKSS